ncbi:hypothetical protein GPECTOR_109g199 [Gonium pectorale]|uniref:Uncharacterized protein n=1 Tax=Gonium pectorale TaxID=33097 RepID=A0A150FZB0_GONPE|nr:hypothetical protein GPECTOR_109g199 [Gonium pectorale]|eukprot:KXZ42956.1 hypothetical protein GPECTOR_109g199 [Gonium pectorale]
MTERVRKFVRQIIEYRKKYGDAAADKLMAEARTTNAVFYDAVVAALSNEEQWDFPGMQQQQQPGSAPNATTQGTGSSGAARRRLMAAEEGRGGGEAGAGGGGLGAGLAGGGGGRRRLMQADGVAATVETAGAGQEVSGEAAASFDIFADGGDLYDSAEALRLSDAIAAKEIAELERSAAANRDAAEAAASGGAGGAGGELDHFLDRLQYDEFGDLESTALYRESEAAGHEHGVDPRAADSSELSADSYRHMYLGDYHGALGGTGWAGMVT